jgi:predicted nuclease of restriction endonuclease-like (RecB) superfamily
MHPNEFLEIKGFSERNIKFMVQLFKEYELEIVIGKQSVSQIPWGHNILLMQKIKDSSVRFWYMEQTIQNGWSRDVLNYWVMIW